MLSAFACRRQLSRYCRRWRCAAQGGKTDIAGGAVAAPAIFDIVSTHRQRRPAPKAAVPDGASRREAVHIDNFTSHHRLFRHATAWRNNPASIQADCRGRWLPIALRTRRRGNPRVFRRIAAGADNMDELRHVKNSAVDRGGRAVKSHRPG